jgi:hypothetical protein
MNKAPFNFNKWNTIIGWFTFVIALITYTLTVEPTMSFGIVENILPQLQLVIHLEHLCFKWLVHFSPCLPQIYEHIILIFYLFLKLISKSMNLKHNFQCYCNSREFLRWSFAYTFSDSFGSMLWKQKFMLWLLCLFPCFFGWVCGSKIWTHQGNDGCYHFTSYRIIFWVHFMAL